MAKDQSSSRVDDDPTRLFARFRAIVACAFLGLVVVAGVMITLGVTIEERRDKRILTELLRGHAYLLDSQAVAFRRVADMAAERLSARLAPLARTPLTAGEFACGGATAANMRRLNATFAEAPNSRSAATPSLASDASWSAAVGAVDFVAIDLETAAPNIGRMMFISPDGEAAAWLGAPPVAEEASAIIAPAACAANPSGDALWVVEPTQTEPPESGPLQCDDGAADGAIRLIRPVDVGNRRAGYLVLELDACAIWQMNADLAIENGRAFLLAGSDTILGAPTFSQPVLGLSEAKGLHPSTRRAAEDPFVQPSGDLYENAGQFMFVQRLSAAPWTMVAAIDAGDLRSRAFRETAGRLVILLALIAGALAMTVALTRREFIDPAKALVADIVARGSGETPPASTPPPGWRPYFQRIRSVFRENTEAAALRQELSIAARMQASILPTTFPDADAPLAIWGAATPAREVGGDFFDFFDLPDGRTAVVIADVSGKGVPAALFMVLSRTLTRAAAPDALGPAECVAKVNRLLAAENPETMFVTLFYGVMDPQTGQMTYANAGHNAPYVIGADGAVRPLVPAGGPALGVFEDIEYDEATVQIGADETLILFTDGVTEAMDPDNQEYGEPRLEALLATLADAAPDQIVQGIEADVVSFANGAPQADDLTMMAIRRPAAAPLKATIGADLAQIPAFAQRLEAWGAATGLVDADVHALSLSLDELMTNAIEYGAAGAPASGFVLEVELARSGNVVTATLRDNGAPFDPLSAAPPDLESAAEDRKIGGLGVHFAKTLTDTQTYRFEDGRNVLALTKLLTGDDPT